MGTGMDPARREPLTGQVPVLERRQPPVLAPSRLLPLCYKDVQSAPGVVSPSRELLNSAGAVPGDPGRTVLCEEVWMRLSAVNPLTVWAGLVPHLVSVTGLDLLATCGPAGSSVSKAPNAPRKNEEKLFSSCRCEEGSQAAAEARTGTTEVDGTTLTRTLCWETRGSVPALAGSGSSAAGRAPRPELCRAAVPGVGGSGSGRTLRGGSRCGRWAGAPPSPKKERREQLPPAQTRQGTDGVRTRDLRFTRPTPYHLATAPALRSPPDALLSLAPRPRARPRPALARPRCHLLGARGPEALRARRRLRGSTRREGWAGSAAPPRLVPALALGLGLPSSSSPPVSRCLPLLELPGASPQAVEAFGGQRPVQRGPGAVRGTALQRLLRTGQRGLEREKRAGLNFSSTKKRNRNAKRWNNKMGFKNDAVDGRMALQSFFRTEDWRLTGNFFT
nr:translation initiation factor IF-2 [Taeniopygia guttata]